MWRTKIRHHYKERSKIIWHVKNIPLTIHRPAVDEITPISFVANADGNTNVIPFRYPFVDIANYAALKAAGYFRHSNNGRFNCLVALKPLTPLQTLGFNSPAPRS